MKKFAVLLIMFDKFEIEEYKENHFDYAYKIIPFYHYEEDNIFDFYEKPHKIRLVNICNYFRVHNKLSLSQFVLRRKKACLFPTKNDNLLYLRLIE